MKIYVDELPKDCIGCPCESEYYCNLLKEDIGCCKWGEIHKNCPLQSISDYTKQVRKEVCDEIRSKIEQAKLIYEWEGKETTIEDILAKIEKGEI